MSTSVSSEENFESASDHLSDDVLAGSPESLSSISTSGQLAAYSREEMDEFQVHLGFFSGPMDLLLHLVSQREVPIEEVPMKELLDQYLELVSQQAGDLDLEKASEYLVIAATLLVLKSKALLPKEERDETGSDDVPEYTRFFESLREQLIAYQTTRSRAEALISSPQFGIDTFSRRDRDALIVPPELVAEGESPDRLGSLFVSLIRRIGGHAKTIRISIEPISIVSYMMKIVDRLKTIPTPGPQSFLRFCGLQYHKSDGSKAEPFEARSVVLGSFIALLELSKRGLVYVSQSDDYAEIFLELKMKLDDLEGEEFSSEFDTAIQDNSDNNLDNIVEKDPKVLHLSDYQKENTEEEVSSESVKIRQHQ